MIDSGKLRTLTGNPQIYNHLEGFALEAGGRTLTLVMTFTGLCNPPQLLYNLAFTYTTPQGSICLNTLEPMLVNMVNNRSTTKNTTDRACRSTQLPPRKGIAQHISNTDVINHKPYEFLKTDTITWSYIFHKLPIYL